MRYILCIMVFLAGCLGTTAVLSDSAEIKEWLVPYEQSRPRDPAVDSSGRVWFCGQTGAYVAYLDPETGSFKKFDLADGANPHNLIIDSEDQIWYAANTLPYIGRLNPDTGSVTRFPMPEGTAGDPHTLVFNPAGNIWFTSQWSNVIGRLDTASGGVDIIQLPDSGSRPYGIKIDGKGQPWIVLFGTNKLATVHTETMKLSLIELPDMQSRPRRLEISDDGVVWYGDYSRGMLGRYDPELKTFAEWLLPGGARSRPYGMAMDQQGHIWLAEGGSPNRLVEFDPQKLVFDSVIEAANARGSIRHMFFDERTTSVWFGEDSNFIGRLEIR